MKITLFIPNGKDIEWYIPGKVNGGGQSKERYERNRQLAIKEMQKDIADKMKELWL